MGDLGGEIPSVPEAATKYPLDAVIVCGMGPVSLKSNPNPHSTQDQNPVSSNLYNFFNAEAGKILASTGIAEKVILSGFASGKGKEGKTQTEQELTEAELLRRTLERANLQNLPKDQRNPPEESIVKDEEARTTFANIINGLNILDKQAGGYFEGQFAVMSSEFHSPRIAEMIKAFGLQNAIVLSAERVMKNAGYEMKHLPNVESYRQMEEATYRGQPAGLQNLQDNPAYVMFELCQVESNRRLWEIAKAMKQYYQDENNLSQYYQDKYLEEYREVFSMISDDLDSFDAEEFREVLRPKLDSARQNLPKHGYTGEEYDYRLLAQRASEETDNLLTKYPISTIESPTRQLIKKKKLTQNNQ